MPWKETTMLEQKLEFVTEWRAGNFNLSELYREFGIKTFLRWLVMRLSAGEKALFEPV